MRKWYLLLVVTFIILLVACGGDQGETGEAENLDENVEEQTLRVAAVESPMTDVVEIAKEILAADNIKLEVIEMGDYIQPNEALANEEIDATFSQHVPFMEQFNENAEGNLAAVQPIYFANFGLYADGYDHIDELPEDVTIGIANDPSNIDRSLRLLESHDLIELAEIEDNEYGLDDIVEGSHNYSFEQAEISALGRLFADVDSVIMNPTHASHLDLTPVDDALVTEKEDNMFAITLVAREDNADSDLIQKLSEAMTSEDVREFLDDREGGSAVPAF